MTLRHCYRSLIAACVLTVTFPLYGQTVTDYGGFPGLPAIFEGPSFSTETSFAVAGAGRIETFSGLPGTPTRSTLLPVANQTMLGRWHKLTDSVALYRSVGDDLFGNTGDDRLIMVTGLPESPTLEPTVVFGRDAEDFIPVNNGVAVAVDAVVHAFEVLRFNGLGANVTRVFSPTPLSDDPTMIWAPVAGDRFMGMGAGLDLNPGSNDDMLVVLEGLNATIFNPIVSVYPLPSGDIAGGFHMSESGVGVYWKRPAPFPHVDLVAVNAASGVPVFTPFSINSLITVLPWYTPTCALSKAYGDSVLVDCGQDPLTTARNLVSNLSATPNETGSWIDDGPAAQESVPVVEGEIAQYEYLGANNINYKSYAVGSSPFCIPIGFLWNGPPQFLKPNAGSLVVLSDQIDASTGQGLADSMVTLDLWGFPQSSGHSSTGQWAGGGLGSTGEVWPARAMVMGKGRVAAFVSQSGSFMTNPTTLRVFTIPSVEAWGSGGPGATSLSIDTLFPGPANPFNFTVTSSQPMMLAWLMIGPRALATPTVFTSHPFLPGVTLHLDEASMFAPAPMPILGTIATLPVNMGPFFQSVAGQPYFVQALSFTTDYRFSNALLVTGG